MTELPEIPRPSVLWKTLTPERRQQAAEAFWRDENAAVEQAEAIAAIAMRIKFRVKSAQALPIEKKARHLVALGNVSEMIAARLLVAFHLTHQRPMMARFLDVLGIAHEDGLIASEDLDAPPAEKLAEAARALTEAHPPEDVALYLSTLVWQDPETWGGLAEVPESRALARS